MKTSSLTRIGTLTISIMYLNGCGLKGDLYIPEKDAAVQKQPESAAPPEPTEAGDEPNEDEKTGN